MRTSIFAFNVGQDFADYNKLSDVNEWHTTTTGTKLELFTEAERVALKKYAQNKIEHLLKMQLKLKLFDKRRAIVHNHKTATQLTCEDYYIIVTEYND